MMVVFVVATAIIIMLFLAGYFFVTASNDRKISEKKIFRACPICGHELRIGENILAERAGAAREGRERIVIKGCHYCLGRDTF